MKFNDLPHMGGHMTREERIQRARAVLEAERGETQAAPATQELFRHLSEICGALDRGEVPDGLMLATCPDCGNEAYVPKASKGVGICLRCGRNDFQV
jgi:hypothetical protein